MTIQTWKPGTLYLPDALVLPTKVAGASPTTIANANFDSGDSDWTKGTGWAINTTNPFGGTYSAEYTGSGAADLEAAAKATVAPGKAITAKAFIATADLGVNAAVFLRWYDSGDVLLSTSTGESVSSGSITSWFTSEVSAVAPANAAKVTIGVAAVGDGVNAIYADNMHWNYVQGVAPVQLSYRNTNTEAGTSGSTEPTWPGSAGATVVDNEITWEAVATDTITWEASSILTSGGSEPTWATTPKAMVGDNTIAWETIPFRITDENCPHSTVVAIAASKVFAGDTDVVRFSATLNARDWSSEDDAGFLPTGLQQKSQVGVNAMGVYRGNLAVWSPSTFQVWQVDPDPSAMQLLDAMEGIGSIYQQAVQPVSDDLFFLSSLGVRTVAIAQGTNNLATGDTGVPIDDLVRVEKDAVDVEPIATYFPGAGQYWLAFRPLTIAAALLAGQFLLTSPVYPTEYEDQITTSSYPVGGTMYNVYFTDKIQATSQVVSGDLAPGLQTYTPLPDELTTSSVPVLGLFTGGLKEIWFEDQITSSSAPVSGLLELGLIEYTFHDEITNSTYPVSGTLT